MKEKPLFIPLTGKYYDEFESGLKTIEFRKYGKRWNERTCRVGRAATLSYGYGKARRLFGVVFNFRKVPLKYSDGQKAYRECFPGDPGPVAEIYINVRREAP